MDDIPSMQQWLLKQSVDKQWECVQKALEQYLGEPLTADNAIYVELQYQGENTRILYRNRLIGTITMSQELDLNTIKYIWTFNPIK